MVLPAQPGHYFRPFATSILLINQYYFKCLFGYIIAGTPWVMSDVCSPLRRHFIS